MTMVFFLLLPAILCFLVLGAHFMHIGNLLLVLPCVVLCFLLLIRKRWVLRLSQVVLILTALEWIRTTYADVQDRIAADQPYTRLAIILLSVAAVNLLAAALFQTRRLRNRFALSHKDANSPS